MDIIKSITAISEPSPDGQRVTALALEYDRPLDAGTVAEEKFEVPGRTLLRAYTADRADKGESAPGGAFVILELDPKDKNSQTLSDMEGCPRGSVRRSMNGPGGEMPTFILPDGRRYQSPGGIHTQRLPLRVPVRQCGEIRGADGSVLSAWETERRSDREDNKVVDDFRLERFEDMDYALYVPADYDPGKQYPLVLFIHDAGVMGDTARITLEQGVGATVWASPENQKEHPCFVLAPEHHQHYAITNDDYEVTPELDTIKAILDEVMRRYSVDRKRVYVTGQSMGFMCSVELMVRYPETFAAALPVGGHYDRTKTASLWDKNVWMFISERDGKGVQMFVIPEMLQEMGKSMGVYRWSADQSLDALSALVDEAARDGQNYRLTRFADDTIWRYSQPDRTDGGGHSGTWHLVYRIKGVRDWLFSQSL